MMDIDFTSAFVALFILGVIAGLSIVGLMKLVMWFLSHLAWV